MSDQTMSDLRPLGTDDVPDVAGRAVRRFRLHVVVFTVVCVVAAAVLGGLVVGWITNDRPQIHATGWSPAQTAVLNDHVGICATPTFEHGGLQVGLLDATAMEGGETALHLVVHGPIAEQEDGNAGSFRRTTNFTIAEAPGVWPVEVQPDATWGEVYVEVPAAVGPQVEMVLDGPALSKPASFVIDTSSLLESCDF